MTVTVNVKTLNDFIYIVTCKSNFYWVEFSDTQVEVRILLNAKECIKLCKSNFYRVEFSNIQLEFKNTFNAKPE